MAKNSLIAARTFPGVRCGNKAHKGHEIHYGYPTHSNAPEVRLCFATPGGVSTLAMDDEAIASWADELQAAAKSDGAF